MEHLWLPTLVVFQNKTVHQEQQTIRETREAEKMEYTQKLINQKGQKLKNPLNLQSRGPRTESMLILLVNGERKKTEIHQNHSTWAMLDKNHHKHC